ncbi:hypothetical protein FGG78_07990 [Thioclava sp. BHET1]|nr:hypothetical protein FGG78_07990 [Thioclava sp. BHET1]
MVRQISSLLLLGLAVICGYLYYVEHYKWRNCFNELGRCFDKETGVVYSEQSGTVWLMLTVLALGGGLFNALRLRKSKR